MDYSGYTTEDFVLDESFQDFVAGTDPEAVRFWQQWIAANLEKGAEFEQAVLLVRLLRTARPAAVAPGLKQQELRRLQQVIGTAPAARPMLQRQWLSRRARVLAASLSALLLVLCAGLLSLRRPQAPADAVVVATKDGPGGAFRLPDGSVVTLNGRSELRYARQWPADAPREVWLTGEAYFQVTHPAAPGVNLPDAAAPEKFVVHTGALDVTVLGTAFNVRSYQADSAKVVLSSGKVQVERGSWLLGDELLLAPGELAEYSAARHALVKRPVKSAFYAAWTKGQLEFDRTPLREILPLLRDAYGLQVAVADPALLDATVSGTLPTASPDVLLQAVARSLGLRSTRRGAQVLLSAH